MLEIDNLSYFTVLFRNAKFYYYFNVLNMFGDKQASYTLLRMSKMQNSHEIYTLLSFQSKTQKLPH